MPWVVCLLYYLLTLLSTFFIVYLLYYLLTLLSAYFIIYLLYYLLTLVSAYSIICSLYYLLTLLADARGRPYMLAVRTECPVSYSSLRIYNLRPSNDYPTLGLVLIGRDDNDYVEECSICLALHLRYTGIDTIATVRMRLVQSL